MALTKEDLVALLKENLKVEMLFDRGSFSCGSQNSATLKLKLSLGDDVISEGSVYMDIESY